VLKIKNIPMIIGRSCDIV